MIAKDFYCIRCGYVPPKEGGGRKRRYLKEAAMYLLRQGQSLLSGLIHIFLQVQ
jgi:hypothetical protein